MFRISVTLGTAAAKLGCEIQIRSLLENAWAELSRADIYTEQVPPPVERQMTTLSRQLARADVTAEKIRNRIARPRRGQRPASDQPLSDMAIAFIFRDVFGETLRIISCGSYYVPQKAKMFERMVFMVAEGSEIHCACNQSL
jgi:hypothetical protein